MSIDRITKTNFVPTKLPTKVPAEKVNEIIDLLNSSLPSGVVTTDTISEKTAGAGVTIDSVVLQDGGVLANQTISNHVTFQGAPYNNNTDPADKPAMASAMYSTHILTATPGGAIDYTLPTGTQMQTALGSLITTGRGFDISIINIGAGGTITVVAGADFTIVGTATIAANTSARFRVRNSAANTFILYRLT